MARFRTCQRTRFLDKLYLRRYSSFKIRRLQHLANLIMGTLMYARFLGARSRNVSFWLLSLLWLPCSVAGHAQESGTLELNPDQAAVEAIPEDTQSSQEPDYLLD